MVHKINAPKEVPNFDIFAIFLRNPFPEDDLFPIKAVIIAGLDPTKFVHNEHGPSPRPPSLNTIPKLMLNRFAHVGKANDALLGDRGMHNASPPFINGHCFMPNKPYECSFFT